MAENVARKVEIIAEIGSVHDGSFGNAVKLIELAAELGADIVKFQTHIAEAETLKDAPAPSYFKGEPRFDYFKRTAFTPDQWRALSAAAEANRIGFLSSPFSLEAVDLLEALGVAAYKIASGEVTNVPLLEKIAATGKRVLLSSGMSDWAELDAAVEIFSGNPLCVMQCASSYPCSPSAVGLNVIGEMAERYGRHGVEVGLSDHTTSNTAAIAAVALGATVVEKHLTFSKAMYGSDAKHAAEPAQFADLCRALREARTMVTHRVDKNAIAAFGEMKRIFEKSVVAARDLAAGTRIALRDLAFKKPGDGIPASDYKSLIGRTLTDPVGADHKFTYNDFA